MKISPKNISKNIYIPPSKSYLHRALIGAFLCNEECNVKNIYHSEDIDTTISALKSIKEGNDINCNESASTLRFLIPISLFLNGEGNFIFKENLGKRPLDEYYNIFNQLKINYIKTNKSLKINGHLKPGKFDIKGDISSQFITGLLMALPLLSKDSEIHIKGETFSKPYIDITLKVLKDFGINIENLNYHIFKIIGNQKYKCKEYSCEGDWSTGAFWYFLSQKYNININNLNNNSLQPDAIVTKITPTLPLVYNAKDTPDLVPLLVAYAIGTNQKIKISGCQRLRYKESDRLKALEEFKNIGAIININEDTINIEKTSFLKKGFMKSYNDHRIVMAYILFSFLTNIDVETDNIICLKKSYPELIDIIKG